MKRLYIITSISIFSNILLLAFFPWHTISFKKQNEIKKISAKFPQIIYKNNEIAKKPFSPKDLDKIKKLIDNGAVIVVDHKNNVLLNYNGEKNFIPASTIKVLTSLVALHYLGLNYRFKTEFAYDKYSNLYIKGYGDPMLTSSEIKLMTKTLYKQGFKNINYIYIDNSIFGSYISVPGNENTHKTYDAKNSGIAANFNTISYKIKRINRRKIKLLSGDKETPLIDYAKTILYKIHSKSSLKKLKYINISIKEQKDSLIYFGELFKSFCKTNKIKVKGKVKIKTMPKALKINYTYYNSNNLENIIRKLLEYSNNFIANQLGLQLGLIKSYQTNLKDSVNIISNFAKKNLKINIEMREASGLSYANKIKAKDMIKLLSHFRKYKHLLKIIKVKSPKANQTIVRAKSGGLKSVDGFVGFIDTKKHKEVRFIIILNQSTSNKSHILKILVNSLS